MKRILPVFKDDTDKILVVAVLVCTIFFLFVPSIIAMLCFKEKMTENSYEITKAIFNFELFLFLISLFFMVPVIGWLIGIVLAPIFAIWSTIVMIIGLCSVAKGTEVIIPVPFEFI